MFNLRHPASGLRSAVAAKLGRCPSCMRGAARGTVVGWIVAATVYLIWPDPRLLAAVLIVAAAFTLLLAAHLSVYGVREARRPKATTADGEGGESGIDRRRFLGRAAAAAGGAAFAALSLPGVTRGQVATGCHPARGLLIPVTGTGRNCDEARANLEANAAAVCAELCGTRTCRAHRRCVSSGHAVEQVGCNCIRHECTATGFVTACDCVCVLPGPG